jgi:hypothetical protein
MERSTIFNGKAHYKWILMILSILFCGTIPMIQSHVAMGHIVLPMNQASCFKLSKNEDGEWRINKTKHNKTTKS